MSASFGLHLNLKELPPPPPGSTGWPWGEESLPLTAVMPDDAAWPTISIVTPSYNQGQFIEATLRSVLLQGYPNFEYIQVDGGSTDNSLEIIRKYEPWLSMVIEPIKADSCIIKASKSYWYYVLWLNSDDLCYFAFRGAPMHFSLSYASLGRWSGACNSITRQSLQSSSYFTLD